jgi:hypothetical protein
MSDVMEKVSILGFAHFYQETLLTSGAHPTPMRNIVAGGSLGKDSPIDASFQVHGLVVIQPPSKVQYEYYFQMRIKIKHSAPIIINAES